MKSARKKFSTESKMLPALASAPVTTSIILNFLNDEDLLCLREANKTLLEVTKTMDGPYENLIQFTIGTGGIYKEGHGQLQDSWKNYQRTIHSGSLNPAILYKITNTTTTDQIIASLSYGEDIYGNGRLYDPDHHTSITNMSWVLAQVHKGRPFILTAELKPSYIKGYLTNYSGLAKEITAIHKAKYKVTAVDKNGHVILTPTLDITLACKVKMKELHIEDKEVQPAIDTVNSDKSEVEEPQEKEEKHSLHPQNNNITLFNTTNTSSIEIPRSQAFATKKELRSIKLVDETDRDPKSQCLVM